jgi:hypothetical protein
MILEKSIKIVVDPFQHLLENAITNAKIFDGDILIQELLIMYGFFILKIC